MNAFACTALLSALLVDMAAAQVAAGIPLEFEPDRGQFAAPWTHVARGPGYGVFAGTDGFALRLVHARTAELHFAPVGGRATAPIAELPARGVSHYLRGDDAAAWIRDVPHFGRLRYRDVWPGVDLVLHGDGQELEHDFELQAGVDPRRVEVGIRGGTLAIVDRALAVATPSGIVRHAPPIAFQLAAGERRTVAAAFELRGNGRFGFTVGAHDPSLPLVIDPVIGYATFLGGSGWDYVHDVAADPQGNAYVVGQTASVDFPTTPGAVRGAIDGVYDAFVAKLDPTGASLVYATYLGGSGPVYTQAEACVAVAVAVDAAQEPVVTGFTDATNFPTTPGAPQPQSGGGYDAFVCRLDAQGSGFEFSTCLGGSGRDLYGNLSSLLADGGDVVLDPLSNAIVTGTTLSTDLPTVAPLQTASAGRQDCYVGVYSPAGALLAQTYFGGALEDRGGCLALGPGGLVVLGGSTISADLPTSPNAYDPTTTGRGFVAVFDASLAVRIASTRFRGVPAAVGTDAGTLDVFVAGATGDAAHPVTYGSMVVDWPGANDASRNTEGFLARFDLNLTALLWSTLVGIQDSGDGIADMKIDANGYPWCLLHGAVPGASGIPGPHVSRVVKMAPDGRAWCSEIPVAAASHSLGGLDLAANGTVWIAGHSSTSAAITPTSGAYQPTRRGQTDAFVVRVDEVLTGLSFLRPAQRQLRRGSTMLATVTIDGPAPQGGFPIAIAASPAAMVTLPANATIPAGQSHVAFPIAAVVGAPDTVVTLTASAAGRTLQATFRVWPGAAYTMRRIGVTGGELLLTSINNDGVSVGSGLAGVVAGAFRHDDANGLRLVPGAISAVAIGRTGFVTGENGYEQIYREAPGGPLQTIAQNAFAAGINGAGDVVGDTYNSLGYARATLWRQAGGSVGLGVLAGGSASHALAINDAGVGGGESFINGGAARRAFVWRQGVGMQDLGTLPGHAHATAYAINDQGEVCGLSADPGYATPHACVHRGTAMTDLGTIGADEHSLAFDLNGHGHCVGFSAARGAVRQRAFVHTPLLGMQELAELIDPSERIGWTLTQARSINDKGQILVHGSVAGQSSLASVRLDPATAIPYGAGCAGAGGRTPMLAGEGRVAAGETFALVLADAPPSTFAALLLGPQAATLPGCGTCDLLVGNATAATFVLDASGRARLPFALPASMPPAVVFAQCFVLDLGAATGLVSATNALELRIL